MPLPEPVFQLASNREPLDRLRLSPLRREGRSEDGICSEKIAAMRVCEYFFLRCLGRDIRLGWNF